MHYYHEMHVISQKCECEGLGFRVFEIPTLVDINNTSHMIPFHYHAKEEMQIVKIFHFELLRKLFLHLQKLVLIIAHQDQIIDINNNEKLHISHLCNIHVEVCITPHKFDAFQE